jgi:RNA polymerase sigma-70 factor (ECF subfamily)
VEVERALADARAAWPGVNVDEARFAAHLGGAPVGLHVGDLYLAWGCAAGDASALAAFEKHVWPSIDAALARVRLEPHQRQDLLQDLRVLLFVGPERSAGRIAQYRGESSLKRWVRAAALREAFRVTKKARREVALDDVAMASLAALDRDPALGHLVEACRAELKPAFQAGLAALPRADRILLRQHFLDRLTIDDLASLHQVHRATAARWVAKARESLHDAVLVELGHRLDVPGGDLQSLLRLARSQLEITLDRLLSVG